MEREDMSLKIIRNNYAGLSMAPPPVSLDYDGNPYEWRMFFDGNARIADSSTLAELIDILIPGYMRLSSQDRLDARVEYAKGKILQLKSSILVSLSDDERKRMDKWELDFLNASADTIEWEQPDDGSIRVWKSDIPVLLIDVFYIPFTNTPRPISKHGDFDSGAPNLVFFKVSTEEDFLRTIHNLSLIAFGRASN